MSIQTKISFPIRKSFYGRKDSNDFAKQDFTNATLRDTPTSKYREVPKVMVLSENSDSEDDSDKDSDTENSQILNIVPQTPKRKTVKVKRDTPCTTPRRITRGTKETPKKTPKRKEKTADLDNNNDSSPSKQKKLTETPSSMLATKCNIKTPKKDKLSPKQLFADKFKLAKKALENGESEELPGREEELKILENFIESNFKEKTSASLYVSGTPGTGKTACLSKIIKKYSRKCKMVYINCTSLKSPQAVYSKIGEELNIKGNKTKIEEHLIRAQKPVLLVLDEIDMLESKNQSVLYSIFEWPSMKKAKLVLIGIANSLDLTDRILPRLQAKCEMKPELLHFAPYSKQQIVDIITKKLEAADVLDVIKGPAMQFLAAKVAAVSGDVRRALDLCKRVIELAQYNAQNSKTGLDENEIANDLEALTEAKKETKAVDYKDVREVINEVYGGSTNADKEESFPIQQKLLLCSLMLILNHSKNKNVNIGMLYNVYAKVCKKQSTIPLDSSEFATICSLIEMSGIIRVIPKKDTKLSVLGLTWDQDMLCSALQDKDLTSQIINDVSCL